LFVDIVCLDIVDVSICVSGDSSLQNLKTQSLSEGGEVVKSGLEIPPVKPR